MYEKLVLKKEKKIRNKNPYLNYSKFYSSLFINLTGHLKSFVLLELLDGSFSAALELTVNLKVVSFV
nr:hypothetical protein [uncultured Methanobrevibacter sp.]